MSLDANFVAEHDLFLKELQIEVVAASSQAAVVRAPLSARHRNGLGSAHGGVIAALCDAAFGAAANSGASHAVVTTSLDVDFLCPGLDGPLEARATLVHAGKHMVNYDVHVLDGRQRLIARAMVNGYVTDLSLQEIISRKGRP